MIIKVLKCQMCGCRFEAKVLDRDDRNERYREGVPVRCPQCNSMRIEEVGTLRRAAS
jgi:predicted Zn-ribbon and HTH transcriptional regulator